MSVITLKAVAVHYLSTNKKGDSSYRRIAWKYLCTSPVGMEALVLWFKDHLQDCDVTKLLEYSLRIFNV